MYTNIHTTVGTAALIGVTALTGNTLIGVACAMASHGLVDLIGEKRFKTEVYYEVFFLALFLLLGYKLHLLKEFIIGAVAGNFFDYRWRWFFI